MSDILTTRIITNVDLRNGHDGLAYIGKQNKVDIPKLKENEFALFINTDVTAAKIVTSKDEVTYVRPNVTMQTKDFVRMIAKAQNQTFETTWKKMGKRIEKILFENYEWLPKRYENIAKRSSVKGNRRIVKVVKKASRAVSKK